MYGIMPFLMILSNPGVDFNVAAF